MKISLWDETTWSFENLYYDKQNGTFALKLGGKLAKLSKSPWSLDQCFFFPVNIESVREALFSAKVHGHKFAFTGTFLSKFTGKKMRSRALFLTFHGHFLVVHGHFLVVHGHFSGSRAPLFLFTGTFSLFTGTFLAFVHGELRNVHGYFLTLFTGTFSRFTGKKKHCLWPRVIFFTEVR